MVKAAGGGGGKGIRVVYAPAELPDALGAARREAQHAFGDARVFLERFVERARHVEIQVLADPFGRTVHLFERECSAQRRHQKVVEESPSPLLDAETRARMGAAAVAAAQSGRLRQCRDGRVHRRAGRRVLLSRNEHAPAGRASGHGDGHGA